MLMDSEENVFYIKSTDASGMPLPLRIFDYKERTATNNSINPVIPQITEPDMSNYITREEFENYRAFVPPTKDEQKAISSILSDMDSEIENITKKVNKYKLIKIAMMDELLTGKIRLV